MADIKMDSMDLMGSIDYTPEYDNRRTLQTDANKGPNKTSSFSKECSEDDLQWLPIVDYAVQTGISTSTLRRHIKANKLKYKVENGRYLILAQKQPQANKGEPEKKELAIKELERKLYQAQEEIDELKMLVAIYEEKLSTKDH